MFLNLGLLGGLIVVWSDRPKVASESAAPIISTASLARETPASTEQAAAHGEPAPFRWGQLDAADYHVYVKNLRNIGCPEATLRAIVTADVHAAYRLRYNAVEKELSGVAGDAWSVQAGGAGKEDELKGELQNLAVEETAEIADLLGLKSGPDANALATGQRAHHNNPSLGNLPVAMPLVLESIDPAALNLSDDQVQVINDVRQTFLNQIGGTNQDPNDPAYLARWQKAQPAADSMLLGMLGNEVYTKYQMMQMALQNQAGQSGQSGQ